VSLSLSKCENEIIGDISKGISKNQTRLLTHTYSDHRFVADDTNVHDESRETHEWVNNVRQVSPESPMSDHTLGCSQHFDDTLHDQDRVVKDIPLS
jgi:hypothetical protein